MVAQLVKNPLTMWETWVRFLGWEDPLEEGIATHSCILAWRIPIDIGAYSSWSGKESDMTEHLSLSLSSHYNIVLVSALHQDESAIGIHTSPLS